MWKLCQYIQYENILNSILIQSSGISAYL